MNSGVSLYYRKPDTLFLFLMMFVLFLPQTVKGQSRLYTPVNHALGGGGTAYIDSYQANFINPANLMLNRDRKPKYSLGFFGNTSAAVGGSVVDVRTYNNYLTGGLTIKGQVAEAMFDDWFGQDPENTRSLDFEAGHVPIGFAYRGNEWAGGFAIRNRVLLDIEVNRGGAEFFVLGLDSSVFEQERPVNMVVESLLFTEVSFGYAMELVRIPNRLRTGRGTRLYVGAAPKLLLAQNANRLDFGSHLMVQPANKEGNARISHDFNYKAETTGRLAEQLYAYYTDRRVTGMDVKPGDYVNSQAADYYGIKTVGVGIDLGATMEIDLKNWHLPDLGILRGEQKFRIAVSINDLGVVRFGDKSRVFEAGDIVDWQGFDHDQETIDRDFNGSTAAYYESVLVDSIGADVYGNFSPVPWETVSKTLPASVNIGAHLTAGRFGAMVDLGKGFNNRGINSRRVYMALGSEYKFFEIWPVRFGLKTGGFSSTSIHFGTGLEFRNFEFSVSVNTVPRSGRYGSAAGAAWSGFVMHF